MIKNYLRNLATASLLFALCTGCGTARKISGWAKEDILNDPALVNAHVGLSVLDPKTNKFLYNYQGDKYFVPASNTKIVSCYASMKFLGDSLPGALVAETADTLFLFPTGDPTLLHADFPTHPVLELMKKTTKPIAISTDGWDDERWGNGWSWNDYQYYYMPERSLMPLYGNIITLRNRIAQLSVVPSYFKEGIATETGIKTTDFPTRISRGISNNDFRISGSDSAEDFTETPFVTSDMLTLQLLADTLNKPVFLTHRKKDEFSKIDTVRSQPVDLFLKNLMYRSDNFYAEQTLLMISNMMFGKMSDRLVIDTLLKTALSDLPQAPSWADGSGLSRYNLFTPQDFVTILKKMQQEFGIERMKKIFATGGSGTISSYYKQDSGYVYAKTGTLTGVVALSGFIITRKDRLLLFSTLVNNHKSTVTQVRSAVEKFILHLRRNY